MKKFKIFWPKDCWESCNEVGFWSPAECFARFKLGILHFGLNSLTHWATFPIWWCLFYLGNSWSNLCILLHTFQIWHFFTFRSLVRVPTEVFSTSGQFASAGVPVICVTAQDQQHEVEELNEMENILPVGLIGSLMRYASDHPF